ncbi:MAG: LLM class flavin-dependent oxidoreductase [Deltaproteobacteria bacterium]|nr:LLM class flavin-dependent oxidoreductase [Deltaproteobacteria bacterium]
MLPLSLLDLAFVGPGETHREALANTVTFARRAEELGYRRVWYAEHHNFATIASSATSVVIAHVAAHTKSIRIGAGGIMLPNHSPLVVAEQFGTLACLHPGRIDLGLGRAPGTDPTTSRALRVDPTSADTFPDDVLELQAFLGDTSKVAGVEATPGKGTNVPLYILGSSLFGARLAARLGLPYGFASHFAPAALEQAVALYRREFRPSAQLEKPHVIAGLNVVAADSAAEARTHFEAVQRMRVKVLLGRNLDLTDEEAQAVLDSPAGAQIKAMATYSAVGTASEVAAYVERFEALSGADELIVVHPAPTLEARLRSLELLATSAAATAA